MSSINTSALNAFKNLKPTGGNELTDSEKVKKPNNGVSSFTFFAKDRSGDISPAIMTDYDPSVTDPSPVSQYFSTSSINTAAKLEKALDDAMAKHKGHLFPKPSDFPAFKTKAQFNYVVGNRVAQFLKQAEATRSSLSGSEKTKAGKVIDDIDRELWERNTDLNEGSDLRMTTYGPYDKPQYKFWATLVKRYDAILAQTRAWATSCSPPLSAG